MLLQSINVQYILAGGIIATVAYLATLLGGVSTLFFYGLINGTHALPAYAIPQFIGAMLGRYYFSKRYGEENWKAYTPVLVAGYYCGMGLIGMAAVALAFALQKRFALAVLAQINRKMPDSKEVGHFRFAGDDKKCAEK